MELVDTHCHLTALELEPSVVLANANRVGVTRMITIGAGEGVVSAGAAVRLAEEHDAIWASVGVHPHDAKGHYDLTVIERLVQHPRVVALGETGLDFFRDWAPEDRQRRLFRDSIALARRYAKPLIIHCRSAESETLQILREERAAEVGGVFHCYSGDAEMARQLAEMNFLVSFTGSITFKKADPLREVVREVPLERMMVETDAPYMAPEPFRGGPSEPMHVYQIALRIAEVKHVPLEEVARITTANARALFRL